MADSPFTAIVLSARPVTLDIPGVTVLPWVSTLRTPAELHSARLDALAQVKTPWCFYLDDDDELPADHLDVLTAARDLALDRDVALVYTDEQVNDGIRSHVRTCMEYDRDRHAGLPMLMHHLVLMRTDSATALAARLPRGDYWTEHMLYFALAREGGAKHLPRVGYVWNRSQAGFSRMPQMMRAGVRSLMWCREAAKWTS